MEEQIVDNMIGYPILGWERMEAVKQEVSQYLRDNPYVSYEKFYKKLISKDKFDCIFYNLYESFKVSTSNGSKHFCILLELISKTVNCVGFFTMLLSKPKIPMLIKGDVIDCNDIVIRKSTVKKVVANFGKQPCLSRLAMVDVACDKIEKKLHKFSPYQSDVRFGIITKIRLVLENRDLSDKEFRFVRRLKDEDLTSPLYEIATNDKIESLFHKKIVELGPEIYDFYYKRGCIYGKSTVEQYICEGIESEYKILNVLGENPICDLIESYKKNKRDDIHSKAYFLLLKAIVLVSSKRCIEKFLKTNTFRVQTLFGCKQ